jgi:D-alanyl-lipoteichoic acid acyltransferase DltB (MBOAT superfamily)
VKFQGVPCHAWIFWLRRIVIFHLVCLAWIVFRGGSVAESLHYLAVSRDGLEAEYVTAFAFWPVLASSSSA